MGRVYGWMFNITVLSNEKLIIHIHKYDHDDNMKIVCKNVWASIWNSKVSCEWICGLNDYDYKNLFFILLTWFQDCVTVACVNC